MLPIHFGRETVRETVMVKEAYIIMIIIVISGAAGRPGGGGGGCSGRDVILYRAGIDFRRRPIT